VHQEEVRYLADLQLLAAGVDNLISLAVIHHPQVVLEVLQTVLLVGAEHFLQPLVVLVVIMALVTVLAVLVVKASLQQEIPVLAAL
jgi:hypothetical protein